MTENLLSDLSQFSGTEQWHKHMADKSFCLLLTDGMKYLADNGKCYWLMDVVASYQKDLLKKGHRFQLWRIEVEDQKAVVTCKQDSNEPNLVRQEIEYTDFPLSQYEFYVIHDGGSNPPVALLKGEY